MGQVIPSLRKAVTREELQLLTEEPGTLTWGGEVLGGVRRVRGELGKGSPENPQSISLELFLGQVFATQAGTIGLARHFTHVAAEAERRCLIWTLFLLKDFLLGSESRKKTHEIRSKYQESMIVAHMMLTLPPLKKPNNCIPMPSCSCTPQAINNQNKFGNRIWQLYVSSLPKLLGWQGPLQLSYPIIKLRLSLLLL